MAFSKKRVEERKDWLRSYVPGTFLDHSADTISYAEFVHKVRDCWRWASGRAGCQRERPPLPHPASGQTRLWALGVHQLQDCGGAPAAGLPC